MPGWKMFYYSTAKNREAFSSHESLDRALNAAWSLNWGDGTALRIEGPKREKVHAADIANHPKKPK